MLPLDAPTGHLHPLVWPKKRSNMGSVDLNSATVAVSSKNATVSTTLNPTNWVLFTYDGYVGDVRNSAGTKYLTSANAVVAKNDGATVDLTASGAMDHFVPGYETVIFSGPGQDIIKVGASPIFNPPGNLNIFGGSGNDTFDLNGSSSNMLMFPTLERISGSDVIKLGQYTGHVHIYLSGNWTAGNGTTNDSDGPMVFLADDSNYNVDLSAASGSKGWYLSGRAASSIVGSPQSDLIMFGYRGNGSAISVDAGNGNDTVSTTLWQYTGNGSQVAFAIDNLNGGDGNVDTLVLSDAYGSGLAMPTGNTLAFNLTEANNWTITATPQGGSAQTIAGLGGSTIQGFEYLDLSGLHVSDGVVTITAQAQSTSYSVGVTGTSAKDTITSNNPSGASGALMIRGYGGNDTITLAANTAEYVVFDGLEDNGEDNIATFTVGSGTPLDVLNFARFLGDTTTPAEKVYDANTTEAGIQHVAANSTASVNVTGKVVIVNGTLADLQNPSHIAALFGSSGKPLSITSPSDSPAKAVIVTTQTGTSSIEIWFAADQNGDGKFDANDSTPSASEIRLVGKVTLSANYSNGLFSINNFNFDNFNFEPVL